MKRIIFFSKNLEIGGMEKALITLLNRLIKKYHITLILEEKKGSLLNDLDPRIIVQEYKLSQSKNILLRKIINYSKRLMWTLKNYHRFNFSCNYATYSVIGSKLAQVASSNNSYYVHSDYYNVYHKNKEQIHNFFAPHNLNKFHNIIFVSKESKANFLKVYSEFQNKCLVINNLLDDENIIKLSNEKCDLQDFSSKNFNLLFVGRLDNTSKNFDLLLPSFAEIIKKQKSYHLFILGDGPYLSNIEKMIKTYKLNEYVTLLGAKKNPYPYIKKCDALIMTSFYEGFPITYLEALCLNKKVFTTVAVSDDYLDIREFFHILTVDKNDIADIIIKEKSKKIDYKVDIKSINAKNLTKIEKLIERSVK